MTTITNPLGKNLPPNVVALPSAREPLHPQQDLHCFAALTCALRQATATADSPEIVSAIFALITRSGRVLRGVQNVDATQISDLMRAIDLLALQLHDIYEQSLRRELAQSRAQTTRMRARRGQQMPA